MTASAQFPRRLALALGVLLLSVAALLPADATAEWLVRDTTVDLGTSRAGVYLWKLATGLLGVVALVWGRSRPANVGHPHAGGAGDAEPLFSRRGPGSDMARDTRSRLATRLALLAVAVALAVRAIGLGDGLWFDEIDTLVRFADGPLSRAIGTFETQNNHLAYSVLSNLSVQAFGPTAAALRLPAALLGVASVHALWRLAQRIAPPAEALLATALLALSSHHVWFSQDARGYTGMLCTTLLATSAFLDLLEARRAPGPGAVLRYALSASFGVWLHPTAVFVVVAHFLIWCVLAARARGARGNRWAPLGAFVLAGLLSVWGYALVLPQMAEALGGPSMEGFETPWRSPLWMLRETAGALAAGLPGGYFALVAGAVVLLSGVRRVAREGWTILALFLAPVAVTAAVVLAQGHNLWPRFFFFASGFGLLLAVAGLAETCELLGRPLPARRRAALLPAAGLCLVIASAVMLPRIYGPKQDYLAAAAFVDARAPAGAVATLEMGNLPFLEYLGRPWASIGDLAQLEAFEQAALAQGKDEVWVVVATPAYLASVQPQTWERLQREYTEERVFGGTLRGGEILVKVRRAAGRDR